MINITTPQELTKIYLITNCYGDPNKVYIGKEKTNKGKYSSRNYDHSKTFGKDIIFTYIDEVNSLNRKDWIILECFWIEYFRQLGFKLMNKNKGGGGTNFLSEEAKIKISKANKGKKRNQDIKNKLSQIHKGFKLSQESKDKISKSLKGKPRSKETIDKMKKPKSNSHKINLGLCKSKPILQYDLEGNFIKEWPSATEAGKKLNIAFTNIRAVCVGKLKTAGKFKWKSNN